MNPSRTVQSDSFDELLGFVQGFFDAHGAAVEKSSAGLEILMSGSLAAHLGTSDHIQLTTDAVHGKSATTDKPADHVYSVTHGSPLLEQIIRMACESIPVIGCEAEFHYVKNQGFDSLVQERFKISGRKGRIEGWARINTHYLLLTCKYLIQSDEQKEGLVWLPFHLETGAYVPNVTDALTSVARSFARDPGLPGPTADQINQVVAGIRKAFAVVVPKEIAGFQESMNRKFQRDVRNLEEYYAGLKKEMQQSLERSGLSEQLVRDRLDKIALIPDELARKKDDLFKKYSIRVLISPSAAMILATPAVKILFQISIGKKSIPLSMFYNPITKDLDPLVCKACHGSTYQAAFCEGYHLLCTGCSSRCPLCR